MLQSARMPDLLVRLYALPIAPRDIDGVIIRRPLPHEQSALKDWIARHFEPGWAEEFAACFKSLPVTAFIALRDGRPVGFACYEATARGFFGPTGVIETERGRGIGAALLMRSMLGLRELGYAYAIIGDAGPVDFYTATLGAIVIPDSTPGIYPPPLDAAC